LRDRQPFESVQKTSRDARVASRDTRRRPPLSKEEERIRVNTPAFLFHWRITSSRSSFSFLSLAGPPRNQEECIDDHYVVPTMFSSSETADIPKKTTFVKG